ncbi:MAG: ankyrin repeat domain-containing protein, partial [Gemmatimonadaceae bacterium]
MSRRLTPQSTLENLKREAKRWLKALRTNDPAARARLERALPRPSAAPTLRDVQHALAREHEFPGWTELAAQVSAIEQSRGEADALLIASLLAAANRGDAAQVATLLDAHPELVNARAALPGHIGKRTALHFAMSSLDEATVDVLLAHGADPNIRDEGDNAYPIHFAAERGHLGIVRKLVEHGADPIGDGTTHELSVIGWAACFPDPPKYDVVEYLLAHGARHSVVSAAAVGATDAIRAAVAERPDDLNRPMDRTNHLRTPLHHAVVKRQLGSLETLLALGADVELRDAAGLTPLDQAALDNETAMVGALLAHGARIELPAAVALGRTIDVERLLGEDPGALRPGGRCGTLIVHAA